MVIAMAMVSFVWQQVGLSLEISRMPSLPSISMEGTVEGWCVDPRDLRRRVGVEQKRQDMVR